MKIMHCPLNGPRNISEFVWGGEVKDRARARLPATRLGRTTCSSRTTSRARCDEWWLHAPTNTWFIADRNTVTDEILATMTVDAYFATAGARRPRRDRAGRRELDRRRSVPSPRGPRLGPAARPHDAGRRSPSRAAPTAGFAGDTIASALVARRSPRPVALLQVSPARAVRSPWRATTSTASCRSAPSRTCAATGIPIAARHGVESVRTDSARSTGISMPALGLFSPLPAGRLLLQDLLSARWAPGCATRSRSAALAGLGRARPEGAARALRQGLSVRRRRRSSAAARPASKRPPPPPKPAPRRADRRMARARRLAAVRTRRREPRGRRGQSARP